MNSAKVILQGKYEQEHNIHYEIDPDEKILGSGATGTVRRGYYVDDNTGVTKEVAIKFLYEDLNDKEQVIARCRREASIHIVHENLVEMLGFVQTGDATLYGMNDVHYHVVSECLHGVMLLDLLNGQTTDSEGNTNKTLEDYYKLFLKKRDVFAAKIVCSVLSGVLSLHDNGYIHRDIDPSNIMITNEGKVKLIDLGIAKRLDNITRNDGYTQLGVFIGKAAYAAPEQVRGDIGSQDKTTDIYAIGILLFQLITGTLPFNGSNDEVIEHQLNSKMPLSKIKNPQLRKIVKKATEKKRKDRFQSAAEFRVALDRIASSVSEQQSSNKTFSLPNWLIWTLISLFGIGGGILIGLIV